MTFSTLILAAGAGTRMKTARAKVAHELLDKPLVRWAVDAAKQAGSKEVITVIGHACEQLEPLLGDTIQVLQAERKGTGHAVMMAADILRQKNTAPSLVVLSGDVPLITPETITQMVAQQQQNGAAASMLTHHLDNPYGYGRVVRNEYDDVIGIVEEKDATDAQKALTECNSGVYCFDTKVLLEQLSELKNDNAQNEYYLTDVVIICAAKGLVVKTLCVDAAQTQGINTLVQLAQATKAMQQRINIKHMEAGVTMLDPDLVWIGPDVVLESDVEILPLTMLYGKTTVQSGSKLGPNTRITNSTIGRDCRVDESVLIEATLENKVTCGPRAYLRPGTVMKSGSKAGTHVEIKNSVVGINSKIPHLSYLGDATLGEEVNIGAGTITCNYDGIKKSHTIIGDHAFVGSDTMLVAPVTLGSDTVIGAGSVITKNVPDGALALERTEQKIKENWTDIDKRRKGKQDDGS